MDTLGDCLLFSSWNDYISSGYFDSGANSIHSPLRILRILRILRSGIVGPVRMCASRAVRRRRYVSSPYLERSNTRHPPSNGLFWRDTLNYKGIKDSRQFNIPPMDQRNPPCGLPCRGAVSGPSFQPAGPSWQKPGKNYPRGRNGRRNIASNILPA